MYRLPMNIQKNLIACSVAVSEIESMLNGKESVDEAVTNMADTINKSIDDYNTVNN